MINQTARSKEKIQFQKKLKAIGQNQYIEKAKERLNKASTGVWRKRIHLEIVNLTTLKKEMKDA